MSICIPCAKEIINNGAQARINSLRNIICKLPDMVAIGQYTPGQADALVNSAIALEQAFCDDVDSLLDGFVSSAAFTAPWNKPFSGGV